MGCIRGKCVLVPVEVPPTGARLLPNIEVVEGGCCENMGAPLDGCEAPPKLKTGAPGAPGAVPKRLLCCVGWLPESEAPPKLMVGVAALPPNANMEEEGWDASLLLLPNVNEEGVDVAPLGAKGFLMVEASDAPAEKVKEALPPVPKMEPVPPGWLVAGWEAPKPKMGVDAGAVLVAATPKTVGGFEASAWVVGIAPNSDLDSWVVPTVAPKMLLGSGAPTDTVAPPKRGLTSGAGVEALTVPNRGLVLEGAVKLPKLKRAGAGLMSPASKDTFFVAGSSVLTEVGAGTCVVPKRIVFAGG